MLYSFLKINSTFSILYPQFGHIVTLSLNVFLSILFFLSMKVYYDIL